MAVTLEEYEDAYQEALLCLPEEGYCVAQPFINSAGVRHCAVDEHLLNDEAVFRLWGGRRSPRNY